MKTEFLQGYRTFLVWVVATLLLIIMGCFNVYKNGEMPNIDVFYWWLACSTVFVGKNYLESKDTKKYVSIIQANQQDQK